MLDACSWNTPGANPFMGDVVAAVDRYTDIPAATRAALKRRMAARQYDDLVVIGRDSIEGAHRYTDLRDMHFGAGTVCRTVSRAGWSDRMRERGLVYCEDGHCLIVPTVCRNVSRVTRIPPPRPPVEIPGGPGLSLQTFDPPVLVIPPIALPPLELDAPTVVPERTRTASVASFEAWAGIPLFDPPTAVPASPALAAVPVQPIPEPSTWALLAVGLAALAWRKR